MIPNIEEIRALTQKYNEQDIVNYMDQIRTAICNGIQQDARSGYNRHLHTWTNLNRPNATTRSSENFKEAINRLKDEFEEAGYYFKIVIENATEIIAMVEIVW